MLTNGEAVSRIRTSLKLIVKDSRLSDRYILKVLRGITTTYISQRLGERSILYDYNVYTHFGCIEFEKSEIVNCPIVDFRRCDTLMKSKKPLPSLIYSRLGSSLKNITSIDDGRAFTIVDINQYRRNKNRKYKLDEVSVYLGTDNHLYIPDEEIYTVNAEGITIETDMVEDCNKDSACKSGWDYEFICPDKLQQPVFDAATQVIASTYASIIQDSNPNGIEKQDTK